MVNWTGKILGVSLISAWVSAMALTGTPASAQDQDMNQLMTEGRVLYGDFCAACHGAQGEGTGSGPVLDGNSAVDNRAGFVNQILWGAPEHGMPPFAPMLTDREIAAIATFVRNSWSNDFGLIVERSVEMRR